MAVRRAIVAASAAVILLGLACCHRVEIAPVMDLKAQEVVGIIEFKSNAEGNLGLFATHKFMEAITEDQKNIQIVELGDLPTVLAAVGKPGLITPEAVEAIGEKYGVKSLIIGDLEVSQIQPRIEIGPGFRSASASADVAAALSAKVVETRNSATVWAGSGQDRREVGYVSFLSGHFSFDAQDPQWAYGGLVASLVRQASRDFRVTHKCVWR